MVCEQGEVAAQEIMKLFSLRKQKQDIPFGLCYTVSLLSSMICWHMQLLCHSVLGLPPRQLNLHQYTEKSHSHLSQIEDRTKLLLQVNKSIFTVCVPVEGCPFLCYVVDAMVLPPEQSLQYNVCNRKQVL